MASKRTPVLEVPEQEDKELEQLAKKSDELAAKAQAEPEAAEEQEKTIGGEWDETIDMIVPRKPKGEEQQHYVCVNDRRYMVPANGKMQKLPKPIALILQDSLEMESEADEYADKLPKRDAMNPGTII